MNDNEPEKLNIEERKIIHILLKHLMDQRNEIAYLKNKAALHSLDNGTSENKIGGNTLPDGTSDNKIGGKDLSDGTSDNKIGGKDLSDDTSENKIGGKDLSDGTSDNKIGGKDLPDGTSENKIGGKNLSDGTSGNKIGGKDLSDGTSEIKIGGKDISEALSKLNADTDGGALLYSVFESELIKALEHYIKNGDGQNTLYKFYTDFVAAIEERNLAATKIKEAVANAQLEDTHKLPMQITTDRPSHSKLIDALQNHLPRTSPWGLYETVAHELLLLHNAGKTTSAELHGFGKLSADGFEKHLTKLVRYGLIKKQAPSNYVLTDKSNRILLELFGVPKTV